MIIKIAAMSIPRRLSESLALLLNQRLVVCSNAAIEAFDAYING